MNNKVVARFRDGRLLKGISLDVDPSRRKFHIRAPEGAVEEVDLNDLKALFYVRTLEGDRGRPLESTPVPDDPRGRGSTMVKLKFSDGEEMMGMTLHYPPKRPYFFVLPVDPGCNNIRVLVNRSALVSIAANAA